MLALEVVPLPGGVRRPGRNTWIFVGSRKKAAWSYPQAWPEVVRVSNLVSFEPDRIDVFLDDKKLALARPHGIDRGPDPGENAGAGRQRRPPAQLNRRRHRPRSIARRRKNLGAETGRSGRSAACKDSCPAGTFCIPAALIWLNPSGRKS